MIELEIELRIYERNSLDSNVFRFNFFIKYAYFETDCNFEKLRNSINKKLCKYNNYNEKIWGHALQKTQYTYRLVMYIDYDDLREEWKVMKRMCITNFAQYIIDDINDVMKDIIV